ncbi:MAG: hypothetical protein GX946_02025 [Oligosphaeraceae bacterium]|nr:hypothetical protein [Oligosphaeraceae bacterium]
MSATNIYLFSGNDASRISSEAEKLVLQLVGPEPDPFSCDIIQESEGGTSTQELLRRLLRSLDSPSFMGGQKLVWLKNYGDFGSEPAASAKSKKGTEDPMRELARRIQEGLPADVILVMNGPGIDRRKALAKACDEKGEVRIYNVPDLSRSGGLAEMGRIIRENAAEKGLKLSRGAEDALLEALGGDTSLLDGELEKIRCYMGDDTQAVSRETVQELCAGQAEKQVWALSDALGKQSLNEALTTSANIIALSRNPDSSARGLIYNGVTFFREALKMRLFMAERNLRDANAVKYLLESNPELRKNADRGDVESMHPYRAMVVAGHALKYTPSQMIKAMRILRDALWQCSSSKITPQQALENAILSILN